MTSNIICAAAMLLICGNALAGTKCKIDVPNQVKVGEWVQFEVELQNIDEEVRLSPLQLGEGKFEHLYPVDETISRTMRVKFDQPGKRTANVQVFSALHHHPIGGCTRKFEVKHQPD